MKFTFYEVLQQNLAILPPPCACRVTISSTQLFRCFLASFEMSSLNGSGTDLVPESTSFPISSFRAPDTPRHQNRPQGFSPDCNIASLKFVSLTVKSLRQQIPRYPPLPP